MIGVVLAAGDGKRLKISSNEDCCKPLIRIKEKRLIEYALDNLIELGVEKAYIVVGKEGDLIKRVLGDRYYCLKLFYVVQKEQRGLVDAFTQAVRITGGKGPVILQLSDEVFIKLRIDDIKNCIDNKEYDFYCGVTNEENPEKIKRNYSVDVDGSGVIKECIEKPNTVINSIKGTGFCIFNSEALNLLINEKETMLYELCDYINYLNKKSKKGLALHIAEKEFNINTFADLFDVQTFFDSN